MLPFSREAFFAVFETYNTAVWPAQVFLYGIALAMVVLALGGPERARPLFPFGLAFLWAWAGILYHWAELTTINRLAWLFGALFVLQGVLFLGSAVGARRVEIGRPRGWRGWTGGLLILYALVVYPLVGLASHPAPEVPFLGVPCPTTIFTFGLLFWAIRPVARHLLVIPLLWAFFGMSAVFLLGVWQDLGLGAAGLLGLALLRREAEDSRSLARAA